MERVRFASIGTSLITEHFLEALAGYDGARYVGAYSRDLDRAQAFAQDHGASLAFSEIDALAESPEVDAVYIASPNSLHAAQATRLAEAGKHVLVEKSFASNRREAQEVFDAASLSGVIAMEAMRPLHAPAFEKIEELLATIGTPRLAYFGFSKVTSRIARLRAGERLNVFDPRLAGGALMDIGVYCVEPAVALFGVPELVHSQLVTTVVPGERGEDPYARVDLAGTVSLSYEDGSVLLSFGKLTDDLLSCQIQGEEGTLLFDGVSGPSNIRLCVHEDRGMTWGTVGGAERAIDVPTPENDMVCEVEHFCDAVRGDGRALDLVARCEKVTVASLGLMDEVRDQAGVRFPADDA